MNMFTKGVLCTQSCEKSPVNPRHTGDYWRKVAWRNTLLKTWQRKRQGHACTWCSEGAPAPRMKSHWSWRAQPQSLKELHTEIQRTEWSRSHQGEKKVWWIHICLGIRTNLCVSLLICYLLYFLDCRGACDHCSILGLERFNTGSIHLKENNPLSYKVKAIFLAHGQQHQLNKLVSVGVCF